MKFVKVCFLKRMGSAAVAFGLVVAASGMAKADSVNHDVSAGVADGRQSGAVMRNPSPEMAGSYSPAFNGTISSGGNSQWLAGLLTPTSPLFSMPVTDSGTSYCVQGSWGGDEGRRHKRQSVPEPPSIIELLLAGTFLLAAMSRAHMQKKAARLD